MRKLAPALFALLTLALSACGTPLSDAPTAPAPAALITDADLAAAPVESGGRTAEITMREIAPAPQGTETTLVATNKTTLSAQDVLPDVSGYVAYMKYGPSSLYSIMRADQITDQKIALYVGIYYPSSVAISGNGNKLYFTVLDEDTNGNKVNKLYRYIGSQNKLTELASSSFGDIKNVSTSYDGDTVAWEQRLHYSCGKPFLCWRQGVRVRTYTGSSFTTKYVNLSAPSKSYQPSISGDGKKLAFLSAASNSSSTIKIMHLNLQTNDLQQVYAGSNNVVHPSPSNNGNVGWAEGDPGKAPTRLKVKTLSTGGTTTIPFYNYFIHHAHLTADGTYMAYAGNDQNGGSVQAIHVAYGVKATVDTGVVNHAYWQK